MIFRNVPRCLGKGTNQLTESEESSPEEPSRINRSAVDSNFVVEMRSGGAPAETDVSDDVATVDMLAADDGKTRQVAVASGDAMAVIQDQRSSIAAQHVGENHHTIRGCDDRLPIRCADIHAAVERAFTVEGIDALAKGGGNPSFHRPHVRSRVGADPVSGGDVAG